MKHKLILIVTASAALAGPAFAQTPEPRAKPVPPTEAVDPFGGGGARPQPVRPAPAGFDPFAANPPRQPVPARGRNQPAGGANLKVRYEVFSLDLAGAASLMRAKHPDHLLYTALISLVDDKKAVQETLIAISTRSGQRSKAESVAEHIYPTEYNPPNTPTAYEVRNTGVTVEVEATIDHQSDEIDLHISPEHVTLAGKSEFGPSEAKQEMPDFESQRISTSTRLTPDVPRFLGTINRPPLAKTKAGEEQRIWIAFVTISHVK